MKVEAIHQFTERDPIDVREGLVGETARKSKRMMIMRQFLWWGWWKESKRWTESNNEERIIVHRHFSHGRFMAGFAFVSTILTYYTFFRRIYNFRSREILNMRQVPFALRFGISALIGCSISYDMHIKAIYDPDLYRVALKYRSFYDRDFQRELADSDGSTDRQNAATTD